MNYNAGSKSASKYFLNVANSGGSSVVCNNCYGYVGAGILIYFSYSFTNGFQFEVKIAGNAGFSVDVDIVNPTASQASKPIQLIPGQDKTQGSSFPIPNTGLILSYWFGGMTATVQGTGSATGTVRGSVGGDLSLSTYVLYDGTSLSADFNTQSTKNPPLVFVSSNFNPTASMDASITVTPTLNLNIAIGTTNTNIGISFYVNMPSTNEIILTLKRRRLEEHENSLTLATTDNAESYSVQILSDKITFYPGESIPVSYVYMYHCKL